MNARERRRAIMGVLEGAMSLFRAAHLPARLA